MDNEDLVESKLSINTIFEYLSQIPILGDKGLSITYTLDKQGYIAMVEGFADIIIDIKAISAVMGEEYSDDFNFKLLFNFKEEYKEINAIKYIEMPKITDENNISYINLLKNIMENNNNPYEDYIDEPEYVLPAPDGSISVISYGDKIDFGNKEAQIIDGTLYVPFEELVANYGYEHMWDKEAKMASFKRGYQPIDSLRKFEPHGDIIYCNDYQIKLSKSMVTIDDYIYVPLKTFAIAVLGQKVRWDEDKNAAYLEYYFN